MSGSGSVHSRILIATLLVAACSGGGGAPTDAGSPTGTPAAVSSPATTSSASAPTTPSATEPQPNATPSGAAPTEPGPTDLTPTAAPSAALASPTAPAAWVQRSPEGEAPAGREDHTWTLDGTASAGYLFGGRDGGQVWADLWRYDLATDTWTELTTTAPAPEGRFGHVAAWVDGVGLVIWSGQAGSRFFSDLWAFDPSAGSWRELPAAGDAPAARYGSCGSVGPDGRLWVSHGFTADSGRFSDTRAYDFAAESWADETPPEPRPVERCLHDCLWTADGQLVLYGGQTTGRPAIGDLWSYSPDTGAWTEAAQPEPQARQLYALARSGDDAYVFGGGSRDGGYFDDLWRLDLASLSWSQPVLEGPLPAPRSGAALIADTERGRLLLFGGQTDSGRADDLWQLDLPAD